MLDRRTLVTITLVNVTVCSLLVLAVPLPSIPPRPETSAPRPAAAPTLAETALRDLASEDRTTRLTALRVLAVAGDAAAEGALRDLAADEDRAIAVEAGRALARITGDAGPLLALVNSCADEEGAIAALGDCPSPLADEALARLAAPRDDFVRAGALRALARRAPQRAVPLVHEALDADEAVLRVAALEVALRAPDRGFEASLRRRAASCDVLESRLAMGALARLGDLAAASALADSAAPGDPWDELHVAETRAWAGLPRAGEAWRRCLLALAPTDRVAAVCRCREEFAPALRTELRALLHDADPEVRLAAGIALAGAGDTSVGDTLRASAAAAQDRALAADAVVALAALTRR